MRPRTGARLPGSVIQAGAGVVDTIVGACLVVLGSLIVWAGFNILVFERSAAAVRAEIVGAAGKLDEARQRDALASAYAWSDDLFVGGRARSLMIDIAVGVREPDTRTLEPLVAQLIERKPTLGGNWLSLAQLRQVNGATLEAVAGFVRMSTILTPHDGHVIVPRVVLAIQNWLVAPEPMKQQAIDELLIVAAASGATFQWDIFSDVLRDQSDDVRSDIKTRLQFLRPGNAQLLRQLGL